MKSLVEYIFESFEKANLLKPNKNNAQEAFSIMDCIYRYLTKELSEELSLTNKSEANKLYKGFISYRGMVSLRNKYGRAILTKYDIDTYEKFAKFLFDNASTLCDENGKYKWGEIKNIKQFNLSEREKEYKKWKDSDNYTPGHKWDKDDFDPSKEERTIVVYDRWDGENQELIYEYPITGKIGTPETDRQINLCRVDWCYQNGFSPSKKYFDAYPKLAVNYYKYGPAKQEEGFNFDDI